MVLVHGPRQCGKTTLDRGVGGAHGHAYVTFDDETQLAAATSDPTGFVANLRLARRSCRRHALFQKCRVAEFLLLIHT